MMDSVPDDPVAIPTSRDPHPTSPKGRGDAALPHGRATVPTNVLLLRPQLRVHHQTAGVDDGPGWVTAANQKMDLRVFVGGVGIRSLS
jgi:hypothetical protein